MKKRQTNRWIEPRKDQEGNLLCLVPNCNNLREMGRNGRMRNYCSKHNVFSLREYSTWSALRMKALKRDKFTCVKCGKKPLKDSNRKGQKRKPNPSALVGDHIIPIALGGPEFDIKNVQTLCIKCDKEKTAKDQKDIAAERKREKLRMKKL